MATETRVPLSRERVLRAGLELADASGVEALTMRRLGEELGFEAMSLYRHVANKQDLLDGMLDLVLAEWQLPDGEGDWRRGDPDERDLGARRAPPSSVGRAAADDAGATSARCASVTWTACSGRLHDAGFDADDDLLRLPPARRLHLRLLALGDRVHLDPDGRRGRVEADGRRSRGTTTRVLPSIATSTWTRGRTARRARSRSGST